MKDWENRMSEVALMFAVQVGEEFNEFLAGEKKPRRCKFTRQGIYQWLSDWQKWEFDHDLDVLYGLLVGEACIKADTDTTPLKGRQIDMKKKVTIKQGLVSLINANVKAHCPEKWVTLNLKTFKIDITGRSDDKVLLFNGNGGVIGCDIVSRDSLLNAAERALIENGFKVEWDFYGYSGETLYVVDGD